MRGAAGGRGPPGAKTYAVQKPALSPGRHTIEVDFRCDGFGAATLVYSGQRLQHPVPLHGALTQGANPEGGYFVHLEVPQAVSVALDACPAMA